MYINIHHERFFQQQTILLNCKPNWKLNDEAIYKQSRLYYKLYYIMLIKDKITILINSGVKIADPDPFIRHLARLNWLQV